MKTGGWISGTVILVALAVGIPALRQQHHLARLRREVGDLTRTMAQQQARTAPVAQAVPVATGTPLSETEKLELLRLRAEVTRLQERRRELGRVREENASLKQRQPAAGPAGAGHVSLPEGYVRRAQAQYLGSATPEAALQSFFWALEHRDTNVLLQVLVREAADSLLQELDRRGAEDFWKASLLPGFRVVAVESPSYDEVKLSVEIIPGEPPESMTLFREADLWRVRPFQE